MLKKIATNTISQIFSKVGTALISIVLIWLLTRYFSVEMYWMYTKIYNYLLIFAFLVDLGLYTITIREISQNKSNTEKIIWNILTLRILSWAVVMFSALSIAYFLPWYNSELALYSIFIVSIFTIIWLINSTLLSLMQAYMKIEFSMVSAILWKALNLFLIYLIIKYFFIFPEGTPNSAFFTSFLWILGAGIFWIILNTFLNFYYANKITKIRFRFDKDYIKHILKISLPYWVAIFLWVVYLKIDVILLSVLEPEEMADKSVALYSLPIKIVEVIMMLWTFFLNSILPLLTENFKQKNFQKYKEIILNSFKVLFAFWVWVLSLWLVFRDSLIRVITWESAYKYLDKTINHYTSSDAFVIVLFVLLFYFISLLFTYILISTEKQSRLLKINIIVTIINIVWNIIFIPKYSFIWAWMVTVFSQITLLILGYFYTKDLVKINFPIKYISGILILGFFIFSLWNFLISRFPIWLYLEVLLYWGALFWLYGFIVYKTLHKK